MAKSFKGAAEQLSQGHRAVEKILMQDKAKDNRNGKMDRVNVRLMPETVADLEQIAAEEGRPVSNLIRQILTKYVEERKASEQAPEADE